MRWFRTGSSLFALDWTSAMWRPVAQAGASAALDRHGRAPSACPARRRRGAEQRAAPMKFERLRLAGFKSFCDPTEFKIEAGLTGVVGPNGCGKSNLVEAMRWVMGESSYKNMRGSGMDDVIFAGSGKRPSRNIAEVGLVLDNSDRLAPGRIQRFRDDRGHPPDRARIRLDLSRQRARGARARRAAAVRRRLHRRPLARVGAAGADRRDHFGQAAGAPADPRGSRGRFGTAFAATRSRVAAEGRGRQSLAPRRTCWSRSTRRSKV